MSLSQLLSTERDAIVAAFVRELTSKHLSPEGTPRSAIVDHIPLFLDEITAELVRWTGPRTSLEAIDVKASAREHGEQRWQLGYDLSSVVREYGVLLQVILDVARSAGVPLSNDEFALLGRYINVGVVGATTEYVHWQQQQQRSRQADLEFLSEAASVLSSSLDYRSTLARLTRLLVPRLADFCIVELDGVSSDETPMAHADPSQVALMREVLHGLPPAERSALMGRTRSGESVLESVPEGLVEPAAGAADQLAGLRALAARSWIVVPLKVQNELFGAITLAWSDSDKSYSRADLLLAEELARKAATAIDNARLYELSRRERERAEAATRTKDEFVAMVSHELRTPLNVIIGWVRLLRSGGLPEKTRAQALEVVERNANAQSQLVGDLLDISRVMTGKIRLDPAQVDLAILVNLVLEDARFVVEAKRLQIHADVPADGAVMRGDAERLKQIVWNLLINAIKFTPKEGTVWVTLNRIESDLRLSVRDSGIGIAPELLTHIFDSFWQSDSKSTRSHGGLGIGLSIAKHLVDLHGGSIEARSEGKGKGAEFIVRLPVSPLISATLGVAKVPVTVPTRQPLARPEVLAGSSVLIIDDEEDARDLLRVVLESCDAKVLAASSVVEGLALLQSEHVDLIVSDVGMPEQDGYDLIRAVRSLPDQTKANLPAIALTAFARAEDRTRALLAGFNVHMSKPVELAELLIALADLVTHTPPPTAP